MSKKVQRLKQKSTGALALQPARHLTLCRGSLWLPQETVGAQFQWIWACATNVDEALNYLQESEPHVLETSITQQDVDLSLHAHTLGLSTPFPRIYPVHIVARENSALSVVQSRFPDFAHHNSEPHNISSPHQPVQQSLVTLNKRELEVLRLLAEGRSNQEIADTLIVAKSTIKWHLKQIYSKLNVHSRTQAIVCARQIGFLS
ncbi:helix-turn-helix transcriptional regulator [Ktedonobacter racemifer]|uniref:Transcriptional regulator, LuxR family n=1 Tax=Ktedonobacter racemifer DSM 44963 TaxID=485913 RepID=D6U8W4_KTERA|nr:response regulator transcription factor [Ktedonobacter racemifer]EFH79572.1 transcriptional regulator, LuxR family [Ktedonobacter racemifer DSM 44963]